MGGAVVSASTVGSATKRAKPARTRYERAEDGRLMVIPGAQSRVDRVVSWVGGQLPGLLGVVVLAGFAVAVTAWAWLACVLVAVGWTASEVVRVRAWRSDRGDL